MRRNRSSLACHLSFILISLYVVTVPCWAASAALEESGYPAEADEHTKFRWLMDNTWLGHAAQSPRPDEPVEVLEHYLEISAHGAALDTAAERATWKRWTQKYPSSRYAWEGLALVYEEARRSHPSDRDSAERAVDAYATAARLGVKEGRILYATEMALILQDLGDTTRLREAFAPLLHATPAEGRLGELRLAFRSYADTLAILGDKSADTYYQRAVALEKSTAGSGDTAVAYARWLEKQGQNQRALDVLEHMTKEQRMYDGAGSSLRLTIMRELGRDAGVAEEEVAAASKLWGKEEGDSEELYERFAHSFSYDDCRTKFPPPFSNYLTIDDYPYGKFVVNLAEIIWNEDKAGNLGSQSLVGWTVRDRVFRDPSCDSYPGAFGGSLTAHCIESVPCSNTKFRPDECNLGKRYCCVEHGGKAKLGEFQAQFNDKHQDERIFHLRQLGYPILKLALRIIDGLVPELSTPGQPCFYSCANPVCAISLGQSFTPEVGPIEFRGKKYSAEHPSCKQRVGQLCDKGNYFWKLRAPREAKED